MNPHCPRSSRARNPEHAQLDALLHAELDAPAGSPDLTRSIMGQLGYMRVSPAVSRRHRFRRAASRAGLALTTAIAMAIAFNVYLNGPEIRRPSGPTLPAAIGNDLQLQQNRIGNAIQTIRNIAIPKIDRSSPASPADSRHPRPLGDDINRSPALPTRWV